MRRGTAKISDRDCIVLVPADSPYDLQALLDDLDWRATRRGPIRVELNRRVWRVEPPADEPQACAACTRPARVRYVNGAEMALCALCAVDDFKSGRVRRPLRSAIAS